ncbi:MAG: Cof-type HAD-IIB family hydrolase [Muribaculaceae bacterium]|nr:Cof-type HAD-IIB family hydrolase [Muribaculaceae bacterium]
MKTLYVSDMDGTLLDNDSKVSSESAEIISELSRRGALITVATARTPATVELLLSAVTTNCPAIVMTGAAMWDRSEKRLVNARLFCKSDAEEILGQFRGHGINPFVYTVTSPTRLDVYYRGEMNRQENAFYQERRHLGLKRFHIGANPDEDALEKVILMFSIGPSEPIERMAELLRKRGGCSVSCYPDINSRGISLIEVFVEGVSKRAAVKRRAEMVGAERIVVFGDNLNDLPMMDVADTAVAVANAFPEVKEKADIVIGRNSDNSVARFIAEDYNKLTL